MLELLESKCSGTTEGYASISFKRMGLFSKATSETKYAEKSSVVDVEVRMRVKPSVTVAVAARDIMAIAGSHPKVQGVEVPSLIGQLDGDGRIMKHDVPLKELSKAKITSVTN